MNSEQIYAVHMLLYTLSKLGVCNNFLGRSTKKGAFKNVHFFYVNKKVYEYETSNRDEKRS